jgi:sodium transport system permease protein
MNWATVGLIWRQEIRVLLRSRRTVVLSIVLPMLVMPLMLFASRFATERRDRQVEETLYRYAITGDWAAEGRALLARAQEGLQVDTDSDLIEFKHEELQVVDPTESLQSRDIHFYLNTMGPLTADQEWDGRDEDEDQASYRLAQRQDGVPLVQIYVAGNRATATTGARRMRDLIQYGRRLGAEQIFAERGVPVRFANVIGVEETSLASAGNASGLLIGRFLTVFLFMLTLTGGSVVAMDIIAGEKERGTLETLLTTAAGRTEIIAAKQLVIMAVALVITLIQVVNLLVYTRFNIIPLPDDFVFQLSPASAVALVLLYVPLAVLVAGLLLTLSAYAKSYKEAQLYFLPVYLVGLIPAFAGAVPGIRLRSAISIVPVANVSVAAREVLSGSADWLMIVVTFALNSMVALALVRFSTNMLGDERLITATQDQHPEQITGPAAFRSQVWRWYLVMWSLLLAIAVGVPQLSTIRAQLLFNELVIFLGGSLLMIRLYGLDVRKALALRPVQPRLWLVIVLMIPTLSINAVSMFRFANTIFPVPRSYLEQFGDSVAMDSIPAWQVFLLLAVLPGICEEIGFRGTLLYGLRRKFRPLPLALVVGLIFGLFHFSLFRIVPTAVIGIVITGVALLTGSIYPGMIMHMGNNAFALWIDNAGFPLEDLGTPIYGGAAVMMAALLWILYRNRTPYPAE